MTAGVPILWASKEKFCTWMYLCCERMDAQEQRSRRRAKPNVKKNWGNENRSLATLEMTRSRHQAETEFVLLTGFIKY